MCRISTSGYLYIVAKFRLSLTMPCLLTDREQNVFFIQQKLKEYGLVEKMLVVDLMGIFLEYVEMD